MSQKTAAALSKIDVLLPMLGELPPRPERDQLLEAAEALRRAVAAFHMEAIRFRMFTVDRLLRQIDVAGGCRPTFDELRRELEAVGFHTRSHTAP
jgi:hypothetical protein